MPLIKSDSDSDSQGIDSLLKRYVNGDARKHALRGSQGLKTGTLPKSSANATHLLRHVKWLLRAAQDSSHSSGLPTHDSCQNSECSGLETEVAFGEVIFRRWLLRYFFRFLFRASLNALFTVPLFFSMNNL
jgi:hypothetical protein